MAKSSDSLLSVLLDFKLSQILGLDLLLGIGGAGGAGYLALNHPESLRDAASASAQIVGVIVGLSLAGVAIQAAFFDQAFLRKSRSIGADPIRYLAPMLFTTTLGVLAALATIVVIAVPSTAPDWLLATSAGIAGFLVFWTLGSLLHNLTTLVSFVRLQADAADVSDDLPVLKPKNRAADGR
jgi:cytochrome bd-type quinol oxidase subunit 2